MAPRHARQARQARQPLPLLDRMYKEFPPGTAPAQMQAIAGKILAADGVIVVSGEYNHGIPPALKNLLDTFLEEWFHRTCGIATYSAGRFGGVRAAMQLRMTLAEIGIPTASTILAVPGVRRAVAPDGADQTEWLSGAIDGFVSEVVWWAAAAKAHKATHGPPF